MANSVWGSADFWVQADTRGFWPLPERDADGVPHYRATVKPVSETEYKNLANNVSIVTIKRGLGGFDFVATVDAGPGAQSLTVPVRAGGLATFASAILIACRPKTHGRQSAYFEVEADWILLDADITPDVV